MKRQDISGENTLHVDGGGGGATSDVNITEVGGTPVTSPLPVSFSGNVTVVQPTGTNLHVVTDATSTTIATQATGTNLHTVTDTGSTTAVTGNVTVVQSTGTNLHAVIDSGSTTAVTGNVTVVQGTGTNLHTVVDSGSVTISGGAAVTQSTSPWIVAGEGTAGAAASGVVSVQGIASMTPVQVSQATGTNLHMVVDSGTITTVSTVTAVSDAQVQGKAASGASKSGNPVQGGAVFNTTQPTVTTGQVVEAQATARGALIVATGTDTFTATVNAGTNLNTSSLALDASVVALKSAVTVVALQVTASGDTVLVASGTHKIRRVEMSNSSTTAAVTAGLKIASVNSGNTFSKKYLPPAGGQAVLMFAQNYLQCTSETISVNLSGTGQVEVTIYYE